MSMMSGLNLIICNKRVRTNKHYNYMEKTTMSEEIKNMAIELPNEEVANVAAAN